MDYQSWEEVFNEISKKSYFKALMSFLDEEYSKKTIFPPKELIFNAFKLTPLNKVKVVIFGQDPYPNPNEAMGLAFSVNKGIKVPPSLVNIFKEIKIEYNIQSDLPKNGDLTYLAKQGVLLLNSYLTCVAHHPLSHESEEYKLLFKDILSVLTKIHQPIVFLLWGNSAKAYKKFLLNPSHLIIETNHPSPLSANREGWFNSNCFIKANEFLKENDLNEINWFPEVMQ